MQHVYLSYPEAESTLAYRLVEDLQAAGYLVFVDAVSEIGSMTWAGETRRAIRTCGAMVMLLHLTGPRRTGMRHEGIAARRRSKPVFVGALSLGGLPRYLLDAVLVDFSGAYETARDALLSALPEPQTLLAASQQPRYQRRRAHASRRWWGRPVVWGIAALIAMVLALVALGLIPPW